MSSCNKTQHAVMCVSSCCKRQNQHAVLAAMQVCGVLDIPVDEEALRAAERRAAPAGKQDEQPGSGSEMADDASDDDVSAGCVHMFCGAGCMHALSVTPRQAELAACTLDIEVKVMECQQQWDRKVGFWFCAGVP